MEPDSAILLEDWPAAGANSIVPVSFDFEIRSFWALKQDLKHVGMFALSEAGFLWTRRNNHRPAARQCDGLRAFTKRLLNNLRELFLCLSQ